MRRASRALGYVASAALLLAALSACGDDDPETEPASSPTTGAASTPATDDGPTGTPSTSSSPAAPAGGPADRPTALEAATDLLDWQGVPGPVRDTVTRSGEWTLEVDANGAGASLEGPSSASGSGSSGERVSDALIDGDYAVVVMQDKAEQRPSSAEVTDLATGRSFTIDGRSDVPTTNGGTWALGGGRLLHATIDRGAYCLASVDLETRKSSLGWCAPKRHGFNAAHITPAGDSMMTFDDSHPSCRTVVTVVGDRTEPFPGAARCKAWEGLLVDGGAVWSVVPNERRIEDVHFYARQDDGYFDLGPGTAGTLVWCGGASYFVRDPQRDGDPAELMRWSAEDGLSVAYRSPGGQAFLAEPRCGGDTITVTALAEQGDEQVSAPVS